jgi:hypothetical protein
LWCVSKAWKIGNALESITHLNIFKASVYLSQAFLNKTPTCVCSSEPVTMFPMHLNAGLRIPTSFLWCKFNNSINLGTTPNTKKNLFVKKTQRWINKIFIYLF